MYMFNFREVRNVKDWLDFILEAWEQNLANKYANSGVEFILCHSPGNENVSQTDHDF